jgi:hypothetical protein
MFRNNFLNKILSFIKKIIGVGSGPPNFPERILFRCRFQKSYLGDKVYLEKLQAKMLWKKFSRAMKTEPSLFQNILFWVHLYKVLTNYKYVWLLMFIIRHCLQIFFCGSGSALDTDSKNLWIRIGIRIESRNCYQDKEWVLCCNLLLTYCDTFFLRESLKGQSHEKSLWDFPLNNRLGPN